MGRRVSTNQNPARTPGPKRGASAREPYRVGLRDDDGTLDELLCSLPSFVHLEQQADDAWWLGVDLADGRQIHVNLTTGGKRRGARITGTCTVEGNKSAPVRVDIRSVESALGRRRRG